MRDKYKNYQEDFFISDSPTETTIDVSKYVAEIWNFDGEYFRKTTVNESASVKIPEQRLNIQEFLAYVDEMTKFKDYLVEPKPLEPKKL